MTDTAPEEKPGRNSLTDSLVGQAAAGITIAAAIIYGAGAMTVAWQWQTVVGACVALAVIPGASAISASTLFPTTLMCSPAFHDGFLGGNLIATNGGWGYMVEYRRTDYSHDFFSVVPLSSVHLMTIGKYGDCGGLIPPSAPKPTARPAPTPAASPSDDP